MEFGRYALIITVPDCFCGRISYVAFRDSVEECENLFPVLDLRFGSHEEKACILSATIARKIMPPKRMRAFQRYPFYWIKSTHNGLIWSRHMPDIESVGRRFKPVNMLPISQWNDIMDFQKEVI